MIPAMLIKIIIFLFIFPSCLFAQNQQPSTVVNNIYTGNGYWEKNNVGIDTFLPVGIGSTNPGQSLDVQGTIRTTNLIVNQSTGSGYVLTDVGGTGNATWQPAGAGSQTPWTQTINAAGNSLINTGNIGIGSATPGQTLDVQGSIRVIGIGGNTLDVQGTVRTQGFTLTGNGASSGFLLEASGSAGIGTWVPAPSGGGVSSITGDGLIHNNSASTGAVTLTNATQTSNTVIGATGTTLSALPIGSCSGASNALIWTTGSGFGCNTISGSGTVNSGTLGNATYYGATGTAVNGTATVFFPMNGNVGINQTTAIQPLDVNGTIRMQGFLMPQGSSLNGKVMQSDASGNGTWQTPSAGSGTVNSGTLNQFAFYSATGTAVNGTTNLIQDNNGNIGINSASPGSKFDIQGSVRTFGSGGTILSNGNVGINTFTNANTLSIGLQGGNQTVAFVGTGGVTITNQATSGSVQILLQGGSQANSKLILQSSGGTSTTDSMTFLTGTGGQERLRISNAGNLGIGSAVPGEILDVDGTVRIMGVSSGNLASLLVPSGNVGINSATPGQQLDVTGTIRSVVGSFIGPGNVGIGSLSPGQLLDVQGSIRSFGFTQTTQSINTFTGNVGMGSATPGMALDVTGSVRATGFMNLNGTTGAVLCLTGNFMIGHCSAGASCLTTCTCTCVPN